MHMSSQAFPTLLCFVFQFSNYLVHYRRQTYKLNNNVLTLPDYADPRGDGAQDFLAPKVIGVDDNDSPPFVSSCDSCLQKPSEPNIEGENSSY
jgi:hypothetical protein